MKHFTTLLLALGLTASAASAQNVIVMLKDGASQKFNADYLSEIKFVDAGQETPTVTFGKIDISPYSGGNFEMTLTNEEKNIVLKLDAYGPKDALFLNEGTYTMSESADPMTIGTDTNYTWLKQDGVSQGIKGGVVVITRQDKVYTVKLELVLESGQDFKGEYTGTPDNYTPFIEASLSDASYNVNEQPAGQFYVKFNDTAWRYDMAMVFIADKGAQTLPAGTYTLKEGTAPGTLSTASYLDCYNPNSSCKLLDGSKVTVAGPDAEGSYEITLNLNLSDGRHADFSYTGTISGTPKFIFDGEELSGVAAEPYGAGLNTELTFTKADNDQFAVVLDTYRDNGSWFQPGEYVVGASSGFRIDPDLNYTYIQNGDKKTAVESGKMTVELEGDVYTFNLDFVLEGGESYRARYTGKLPNCGPLMIIELSSASYSSNATPEGNFYVKFNDSSWSCEMALDMFGDTEATSLPAGTYTYSTENTRGTFGSKSYVELSKPFPGGTNRLADGSTVTVDKDSENYTIAMNLVFEDGRKAVINFTGQFSNAPTFE